MLNIFLLFCSSVVLNAESHADDFWYDMGDSSWETSNYLASYNPYYKMYRQSAAQMDWYSYAQHVGKINRGQSVNTELNMPRHRAFGYQSDFNPQDLKSGGFNYKVSLVLVVRIFVIYTFSGSCQPRAGQSCWRNSHYACWPTCAGRWDCPGGD